MVILGPALIGGNTVFTFAQYFRFCKVKKCAITSHCYYCGSLTLITTLSLNAC